MLRSSQGMGRSVRTWASCAHKNANAPRGANSKPARPFFDAFLTKEKLHELLIEVNKRDVFIRLTKQFAALP